MSLSALLIGDTVQVTPYEGEGAYGPSYGAPVVGDCRAVFDRQLVRNDRGDEVVSEATLFVLPTFAGRDAVALFAPESRVTVNGQRDSQVIMAAPMRGQGPVLFVQVTLR